MSAEKLKLGVMGWPVRQSLSPELFLETFSGRPDVLDRFSYDLLEEDTFGKAFERFQREYYAVNVTIPYKEPAFRAADEPSALCRAVGAANLLIHRDGRVVAHNTDILAVAEILRRWLPEQETPDYSPEAPKASLPEQETPDHSPEVPKASLPEQETPDYSPEAPKASLPEQETPDHSPEVPKASLPEQETPDHSPKPKVLVVGCGGAGKAAVAAALSEGAEVTVTNRTAETAVSFISCIKEWHHAIMAPQMDSPAEKSLHFLLPQKLPDNIPLQFSPLNTLPAEVRRADFIIYTLPVSIPELEHCDFTGKTVLEAKYYDPSIKQIPEMIYIPGTEWLRLQALATYRILGLIQ